MEIKLKLKVRDIEIELTQNEAAELAAALDGVLGKETIVEKYVPSPWAVPYYHRPWYDWWPNPSLPYIWRSSNGSVQATFSVTE